MSRVAVVMPVYNAERFLDESIRSILGQTFQDFEFIIVNDGSTDGSSRIITHYASLDSRIKVITQQNSGVTAALNNGIASSNAEYIARMDADDLSLPERLEYQVEFLDSNQDFCMCGTDYEVVNLWGDIVLKKVRLPNNDEDLRDLLRVGSPFAHGSVMYRRDIFNKAGGYRKEGGSAEDYDLWVRLAENGKLSIIPKTLFQWRLGDSSITTINSTEVSQSAEAIRGSYNSSKPPFVFSVEGLIEKEQIYSKIRFESLLTAYGKLIVLQLKSKDPSWSKNLNTLIKFGKAGRHTIADRILKIISRGKKQLRHE